MSEEQTLTKPLGVIQPLPGVGDMVWHLPALERLREDAQGGRLALFSKHSAQAIKLLAAHNGYDHYILPIKKNLAAYLGNLFETARILRAAKIDTLYILHHSRRYLWAATMAGIKTIHIYPKAYKHYPVGSAYHKAAGFLQSLSMSITQPNSHLAITQDAKEKIVTRFGALPKPWFVVAPGASANDKIWPLESFSALINALMPKTQGTFFILGAPSEKNIIHAVHAACADKTRVSPVADTPLDQSLALIKAAQFLVGNCSGPVNMAAALGVPAFVVCLHTQPAPHSPHLYCIKPVGGLAPHATLSVDEVLAPIASFLNAG